MDERVYAFVRTIPLGMVASYATVAELCGYPGRARMVGWALRRLPKNTDVPWQRVIASSARISILNPDHPPVEQVERLKKEGIEVEMYEDGWYVVSPRWYKG